MIPALQIIFQKSFKPAFLAGFKYYSTASSLSILRKRTGFSVANCRKALDLHGNDLDKAEAWLNSQAQANGWEKAIKLQNRATQNGLIGVTSNGKVGVMLEVNCETDFVSRNQTFRELVTFCTNSLYLRCLAQANATTENKIVFNSDELTKLDTGSNTNLADYLAFNIGKIGENILVRRGVALYSSSPSQMVAAGIHPKAIEDSIALGKYGALVLIDGKRSPCESINETDLDISDFPRLLSQHIIGMNPKTIKPGKDITVAEDDILYNQEFVANPTYTVGEIVEKLNSEVQHFIRYECGEQS